MQETEGTRVSNGSESRWGFLVPWTALLTGHEIRVKTKCIADDTYRFTFDAIYLNMQRNVMLDHASHRALQTMAEAVHLVATALALYPDAWTALLVDQCDCGVHFDPAIHNASELVPRFEFDCSYYPGDILMEKTGLRFFEVLLDSTARTSQFHTAMQRLLLLSGADSCVHRSLAPVAFRIDLSLWNEDQDILLGFMDFVRALKPFNRPIRADGSRPWSIVETIELDWTGPGVCSDLVQRTIGLVADAPFVQITTATIDPEHVSCSSAELRQLVTTLTTTYPKLKLRLGNVVPGSSSNSNRERDAANSAPKLAMVIDAVGSTQASIQYLNIGHLVTVAAGESDRRQAVWNSLFGTLLSPSAACEINTLALISPHVLNVASDARKIYLASASHPSYKMPARLILGLTDASQASVRTIVAALGANLQELCLYDRRQVIPSETIAFILQTCPKLACLDLDNVAIESMDMFFGTHARCQLKRLILNNVALHDKGSLRVFLKQLADPHSRVGGSLSEFVLGRYGHTSTRQSMLAIDVAHIGLVQDVLRSNGRILTLQLDVDETVPPASISACVDQHGEPAAVRLAPLALPRKLAFLSVLDAKQRSPWAAMGADVVCNVFEFAAECKPRWVHAKRT